MKPMKSLSPQALRQFQLERIRKLATANQQAQTLNNRPSWRTIARPDQIEPSGDWTTWLILAGRGFGKTRTGVEWVNEQATAMPGSRGIIVASTAADVRDIVVEGESGLKTIYPDVNYEPSKRRVTWKNGTTATLFSADEPNSLRGPQGHWAFCDELAKWRYPEAFDQMMLGLRLGKNPRVAIATTPRPTQLIKKLLNDPNVHVTRGSTYDNRANLAPTFFNQIIKQYEGTRLGRQELNAEVLDDVPGALWTRTMLDGLRVTQMPNLVRIVVAVDPEATSGNESNETGIIVAGISTEKQGYVLDDVTLRASPHLWASQAITAYHKWRADRIVYEANQGGEMVEHTLRTVDTNVPLKSVYASKSKVARAEPIAALYEQGRVHHVGAFGELEDQLCNWLPGATSPDRLDALVWAMTELMIGAQGVPLSDVDDQTSAQDNKWAIKNAPDKDDDSDRETNQWQL